jgi:hypothetical protein
VSFILSPTSFQPPLPLLPHSTTEKENLFNITLRLVASSLPLVSEICRLLSDESLKREKIKKEN